MKSKNFQLYVATGIAAIGSIQVVTSRAKASEAITDSPPAITSSIPAPSGQERTSDNQVEEIVVTAQRRA